MIKGTRTTAAQEPKKSENIVYTTQYYWVGKQARRRPHLVILLILLRLPFDNVHRFIIPRLDPQSRRLMTQGAPRSMSGVLLNKYIQKNPLVHARNNGTRTTPAFWGASQDRFCPCYTGFSVE